jgi:hypothetical protein
MANALLHRLSIAAVSSAAVLASFAFYALYLVRVGVNAESDALFAGMSVAQVFGAMVSAPMAQFMMNLTIAEHDEKRAALPTVLRLGWVFFVVAMPVYWFIAAPLMAALFPETYAHAPSLLVGYYRQAMLLPLLTSFIAILETYMQATRRYRLPRSALLAGRLSALLTLVLLPDATEHAASILVLGSAITAAIMLVPAMRDMRVQAYPRSPSGPIVRRWFGNFGWSSILKTDGLLDNALLALLPAGAITVYNFGRKLLASLTDTIRVSFIAQDGRELYDGAMDEATRRQRSFRFWRSFRLSARASAIALGASALLLVIVTVALDYGVFAMRASPIEEFVTPIGILLVVALGSELFTFLAMAVFQAAGREAAFLRTLGIVYLALAGIRYAATWRFGLLGFCVFGSLYWLTRLAATSMSRIDPLPRSSHQALP